MAVSLERKLDAAMQDIYVRAKEEAGYNARYFLEMLHNSGGLATARSLVNANRISDGFSALWERGRLDLTVEAMLLERTEFHALFTEEELAVCRKRLRDLGYEDGK